MLKVSAKAGAISGAEHLTRISETVIDFSLDRPGAPQYAQQQSDGRTLPNYGTWGSTSVGFSGSGGGAQILPFIDGTAVAGYGRWAARCWGVNPDGHYGIWPGNTTRPLKVHFHDAVMPRLPGVTMDRSARAFVIEAILRKYDNASLVNAMTGFFLYHGGQGAISPVGNNFVDPRVGLLGDGATGFRFGSAGCPDGNVSTSESFIDAGSVQPAALIDPGLNFFVVKFKVVPAVLGGLGPQIACYLDDTLIATFTTITNFPRGRALASTYNYMSTYPYIGMFQPAAVAQRNGLFCAKLSYWWDSDLSV